MGVADSHGHGFDSYVNNLSLHCTIAHLEKLLMLIEWNDKLEQYNMTLFIFNLLQIAVGIQEMFILLAVTGH